MTRRADRLFRIVRLLQIHGRRTAAQLADALDVTPRTIYRDMDVLSQSGTPVQGNAGDGYRLLEGWKLPPMQFTATEVEAIILGLRMASAWGDATLSLGAVSAHERLLDALPSPLRDSAHALALLVPEFHISAETSAYLQPVREAIRHGQWLDIRYRDAQDRLSIRRIQPLGVFFWGNHWTLGAWCTLRHDFRHFRLERVLWLMSGNAIPVDARHTLEQFMLHVQQADPVKRASCN